MRMAILLAVFSISLIAEACPPPPGPPAPDASDAGPGPPPAPAPADASPPPPVDAGASVYARACANLAAVQCSEGTKPNCAAVLEHAQTSRLTDLKPECLAAARTKAEARACGSVKCP